MSAVSGLLLGVSQSRVSCLPHRKRDGDHRLSGEASYSFSTVKMMNYQFSLCGLIRSEQWQCLQESILLQLSCKEELSVDTMNAHKIGFLESSHHAWWLFVGPHQLMVTS